MRNVFVNNLLSKKTCFVGFVILSGLFGSVYAQSPAVNAVSLPSLIERLLQNNAQLRSAAGVVRAAQFGVDPARAPDNPTFNVSQDPLRHNPFAVGTSTGMAWSISQNIYWPGKRQLAGDIVQAQANSTKEQVDQLKIQLLGQLKSSWISWQQTNAQINVSTIQAERLEQIKEILRVRYANNAAAYVDFINAQVTQAQIKSDIIGLERQAQTFQSQIAVLIGQSSDEPKIQLAVEHVTADKERSPLTSFKVKAHEVNPLVKASKFSVEAAQRVVELAELGKRPDFSVGVTSHSAAPPWGFSNSDSYGLSVGVTFPLYFLQKEKNLIDQAKAQLGSARDADESLLQQIDLAVETAYLQWAQSLEQLKLVEERVVAQARVGYRLALSNYSNNQMSYAELLNSYNALRSAELSAEQARANALQSRIALNVAVGDVQK